MGGAGTRPVRDNAGMTQKAGRRPGKQDTRSQIVRAAGAVFAEAGYAEASIRGIAQRAGVDPALVHHYFDGKVSLFIEAMGLPGGMREVPAELRENPASGAVIVRAFLRLWDEHESVIFLEVVKRAHAAPVVTVEREPRLAVPGFKKVAIAPEVAATRRRRQRSPHRIQLPGRREKLGQQLADCQRIGGHPMTRLVLEDAKLRRQILIVERINVGIDAVRVGIHRQFQICRQPLGAFINHTAEPKRPMCLVS